MAFDRNRQLDVIADDLRRHRDTIEKLNVPHHQKLVEATIQIGEAAALLKDVAGQHRVERF